MLWSSIDGEFFFFFFDMYLKFYSILPSCDDIVGTSPSSPLTSSEVLYVASRSPSSSPAITRNPGLLSMRIRVFMEETAPARKLHEFNFFYGAGRTLEHMTEFAEDSSFGVIKLEY